MAASMRDIDQKIKERLYDYGHFQNPITPESHGLTRDEIIAMPMNDERIEKALLSFQQFMGLQLDADPGPITRGELLNAQRCGQPDYGVVDKDGHVAASATGGGAWPHSCDTSHPDSHVVTVSWSFNRMPDFLEDVWDQCWANVITAYKGIGILFERVDDDDSSANMTASFRRLNGPIGLAIVGGPFLRCNSSIWQRFEPGYRPRNIVSEWTTLMLHEFGHSVGLDHNNQRGIMYPSIIEGLPHSWVDDPSLRRLERLYGGEPIDSEPDPPDGPEMCSHVGIFGVHGTIEKRKLSPQVPMSDAWNLW